MDLILGCELNAHAPTSVSAKEFTKGLQAEFLIVDFDQWISVFIVAYGSLLLPESASRTLERTVSTEDYVPARVFG